jgi:hypothetical protein
MERGRLFEKLCSLERENSVQIRRKEVNPTDKL